MMASLAALAELRSSSRLCTHLRRAKLNLVRAAEKRDHRASASSLSMRMLLRWCSCHCWKSERNLSAVERQLVFSSRESANASAFSTMAVRSLRALAMAALRASVNAVFLAAPSSFSASNWALRAARSPTTAGCSVSVDNALMVSSISRDFTLLDLSLLANRSSLAFRSR